MQVSAGGDPLGTLDLFSVHGYPIWNEPVPDRNINMFLRPKAHWMLDKPVAVGEHWQQVCRVSLALSLWWACHACCTLGPSR